jgi:hypothetical protein
LPLSLRRIEQTSIEYKAPILATSDYRREEDYNVSKFHRKKKKKKEREIRKNPPLPPKIPVSHTASLSVSTYIFLVYPRGSARFRPNSSLSAFSILPPRTGIFELHSLLPDLRPFRWGGRQYFSSSTLLQLRPCPVSLLSLICQQKLSWWATNVIPESDGVPEQWRG